MGERKLITKSFDVNKPSYFQSLMLIDNKTDKILQSSSRSYKLRQYLNLRSLNKGAEQAWVKQQRQLLISNENKHLKKSANPTDLKFEGVFAEILTVLNLFMGNRLNIVSHFCCINKNTYFFKSTKKTTFIAFQRFRSSPFLKTGMELLFHVVYNSNSAHLLAEFIASQLKKIKRHKFLLSFLKQTLTVLLNSNLSKIKGIKLIVKGRLNGVPRAKHKILTIGDVPVQSIAAKLDFSQTTTHNANGSYGIKVWVVEK